MYKTYCLFRAVRILKEVVQILKLLLGGSPCTFWSIARTKERETEPSGIGWELFKNYLIAREKYRPDYFLYENNKSMANAIREQITKELGVEPILINSALVSAQNRQRLYWTNIPGVQQPEDRGILLRDVLDDTVPELLHSDNTPPAAEVLNINPSGHGMNGAVMHINGKSRTITTNKSEGQRSSSRSLCQKAMPCGRWAGGSTSRDTVTIITRIWSISSVMK